MKTERIQARETQAAQEFTAAQTHLAKSRWYEVEHCSAYGAFFHMHAACSAAITCLARFIIKELTGGVA